ncbi:MAG: non-canonical purine NTP pyrophosphatase [Verrucomicrobia bacterium]|nr:non-canonical purine NTP pyrophosphatase [Verrucomicrobiota bacterium]MBS0637817.1 non-canonical purine NTP pyrophosphatase [Verrucomicrobiota bacterium]
MELVIASSNTQKVFQIREILKEIAPRATVVSLFDFPDYALPPYDPAKTIAENALAKAHDAAKTLQKCCLSEQWGLMLPSISHEIFHGDSKVEQIKAILNALSGKSEHERTAFIESSVACVSPNGKERIVTGRTEGYIADSERGKGSSDFDSIFIKHDYAKTLAELTPSVRSRISPRRKALEKLIGFFETL